MKRLRKCNRRKVAFICAIFVAVWLAGGWHWQLAASETDKRFQHGQQVASGTRFEVAFDPGTGSLILTSKLAITKAHALRIIPCLADGTQADKGVSCDVTKAEGQPSTLSWECRAGAESIKATVVIDTKGTITVKPGPGMGGVMIFTEMEYAVLPSRWVESTNYFPAQYAPAATLHLPPENLLLGLCAGGNRALVLAWPSGKQAVAVTRNEKTGADSRFSRVRVMLDGRELHLCLFDIAGIWHKIVLKDLPLEKDITLDWKRPHQAFWITELIEGSHPLVYQLATKKYIKWRPTVGYYQFPLWFDQETAYLHLSKKIPPRGVALIYALEGHPATPYAFLTRVLPPREQESLLELGKCGNMWSHKPKGPRKIWGTACGARDRMYETIFKVGAQQRELKLLRNHADDRVRVNTGSEGHNQHYLDFITAMKARLREWSDKEKDQAEIAAFLKTMKKSLKDLDYRYQKAMKAKTPDENIARSKALAERIKVVAAVPGREREAELRWLIQEMNRFMGLLENVGRNCGLAVRLMFREAANACVARPASVEYAVKVRQEIREFMIERGHYESPFARPNRDLRRRAKKKGKDK